MMVRETTNKILELVESEQLDAHELLIAALNFMSEDKVKEFAEMNGLFEPEAWLWRP